ncbi:efflux RND transporter periplasmic adaptor subunit [Thiobacter aerophilum]|uniref:Efflux RND transporter periplasmic adaptor subunit n=1 Tax=Thiobacter aerophilum TaxID=3121275 RepID=A0ABV0EB95_9BURK
MTDQASSIQRLLGREAVGGRRLMLVVAGLVLLAAAALAYFVQRNEAKPRYETEEAKRGRLEVTVSATGSLQPTNQVDVGSELSGIIDKVFVDVNDQVKRGQVLARLDTRRLEDQVARSRAALVAAEATVAQARATLQDARANLARLEEVARLSGGKVPSQAELETGRANVAKAEAAVKSAEAGVEQARATLRTDETNLAKASIRSPIDGVVLTRKVEPGQTVAASLQAPVLFTLAEDLTHMELQVNVDEADVGQVKPGQKATFTVDAWPGRKYPAVIERVAYGSQVTEGVVYYPTTLRVNNDDLSLRPGMTATAEILTAVHDDVLLIPNAALRFTPRTSASKKKGGILDALLPKPPRPESGRVPKEAKRKDAPRRVWVLQDGTPTAVEVTLGLSNGRVTEVLSGGLKPGMKVITDMSQPAK